VELKVPGALVFSPPWFNCLCWARPPYCGGFGTHSNTMFGRTFLDERSACRRAVCLTTHNPHKRQTSMPLAAFEPEVPSSKWPQTHSVDHAATGIELNSIRN